MGIDDARDYSHEETIMYGWFGFSQPAVERTIDFYSLKELAVVLEFVYLTSSRVEIPFPGTLPLRVRPARCPYV